MDAPLAAAARALAAGDPLAALNHVALRGDAAALALRGIAMAQLGELARARALLRQAARAFGARQAVARARCVVAQAEIALAARELSWPEPALAAARATLQAHGDHPNAAHAGQVQARRLLLLGQLDGAERVLAGMDPRSLSPALLAVHELVRAGIALRRLQAAPARQALARAQAAARQAGIPALAAEVRSASQVLRAPMARRIRHGQAQPLRLPQVQALLASDALVVDECRHAVRQGGTAIALASRPVLFGLARLLGEAWPGEVPRDQLVAGVFRTRQADESHRVRLRVEIGRLRKLLRPLAEVRATGQGFALVPVPAREVVVLAQPAAGRHGAVLALLADGAAWSSSALALGLGTSQRAVQRALESLAAAGKVQACGQGRARRWVLAPVPGFATTLLLPQPFADG
ncbi:helix-turn-helix domain-containing protein [Orrella sp. JC864]|uniref:helix-turn-helix domain-containing protein n=1 Tax=Orrella sp. JC864 TaxID=3120298 RepID=UPI003009BA2A